MEDINFKNNTEICGVVTRCEKLDTPDMNTAFRILVFIKDEIQATVVPVIIHPGEQQMDITGKIRKGTVLNVTGSIRNLVLRINEENNEETLENCVLARSLEIVGYADLTEENTSESCNS